MTIFQWTRFDSVYYKRKWFWHRWKIPVSADGVAAIPRGYLEGAAVKITNATGMRIFGVEICCVTTIPRELEFEDITIIPGTRPLNILKRGSDDTR